MDESDGLRKAFVEATDHLRCHLGEVANSLGRTRRSVQQLRAGDRGVSPEVALELAGVLRDRADALLEAADELERVARKED